MFNRPEFPRLDKHQHFKVFTINGGASNAKWSVLQSRDFFVEVNSAVFIDKVVYFLMNGVYNPKRRHGVGTGIPADYIGSLDIETEEWRRDIQGPISGSLVMDNIDAQKDHVSM
uniref:Uncharacterized protein n=1 Tax=Arundo donax TaxID=35708 RepID=A0A0A9TUN4_ARUDO